MYCPKCGTHNPVHNNYCRACREDLRLVAQAVKKSLPVKVAAKIDALLDSKSERFRIYTVYFLLVGLGSSASLLWRVLSGKSVLLFPLLTGLCFARALWEYFAYKHSLTLRKELDALVPTSGDSTNQQTRLELANSQDDHSTESHETARTERLLYCPGCGAGGLGQVSFCPACGTNIQSVKWALGEGATQSWFSKQLDRYVRWESTNDRIGQVGKIGLFAGPLLLLISIVSWVKGMQLHPFSLPLGVIFTFLGLWDYLIYRRRLTSEGDLTFEEVADRPDDLPPQQNNALPLAELAHSQAKAVDTSPFSIIEEPTRKIGRERE